MRKILIIWIAVLLQALFADVHTQNVRDMKDWQVRGLARNALRFNDYHQAIPYLEEWHRRHPDHNAAATNLARCYFRMRDFENAERLFYAIYSRDTRSNMEALFYYALIQKMNGNYEEALEHFDIVRRRHRGLSGSGINRTRVEREMEGCQMGIAAKDTVVTTEIMRFDSSINSTGIQFGPVLISDNEFVYGSIRDDAPKMIALDVPYKPARNFYRAVWNEERWIGSLEPMAPFINDDMFDTGRGAFSVDRKRFYTTRCFVNHHGKSICNLYMSRLVDDTWQAPEKLDRMVNHPRYSSTHPAVGTSFDASLDVLYFVSDRPGGAGGMDIWYSVYDKRSGTHRKAQNAGVFINTPGDEVTPFFDLPSHRLYFSSDGWPGYGGFDVFYAVGSMVTWEAPVNIGPPVNSSYDDVDYVRNRSGRFGLFASNRPDSGIDNSNMCCDDLFAFYEAGAPRVLITGRLVSEDRIEEKLLDHRPESPSVNADQPEILRNRSISVQLNKPDQTSVFLQEVTTNDQGEFEIWVDPGMEYTLSVADTTLLDRSFRVSTMSVESDETLDVQTVALNSIPQRAIVIDNIYYEFNETELTQDAMQVLDGTLLQLLLEYPYIMVELGAHTDNIGDAAYNLQLSERRAANVVKYLVSKGIHPSRLKAKGYGQVNPVAPNQHDDGSDNPEGRQRNRRTEFKVIGLTEPLP